MNYLLIFLTSSNLSITSLDGFPVARLTTIITNVAKINAGKSSYTANIPPSLAIPNFHMNIIAPPAIIPDTIPYLLALFQKSEQRTTGPNAAPKPAHANDTISNTLSRFAQIIHSNRYSRNCMKEFLDSYIDGEVKPHVQSYKEALL